MSKVYHYTGSLGLLGIIQGSVIRCTNLQYLNDKMEHVYAINSFQKECNRLKEGFKSGSPHQELYNNINNWISINIKDAYVACFTENADNTNHWLSYGRNDVNYAIEFNKIDLENGANACGRPENVKQAIESLGNPEGGEKVPGEKILKHFKPRFSEVYYDNTHIDKIMDINSLSGALKSLGAENFASEIYNKLCFLFPATKNPEWRHENEFRLILSECKSVDRSKGTWIADPGKETLIKWKDNSGILTPFVEFPLNRHIIKKVTYHSRGDNKRIEESLLLLKRLYQLEFEIENSVSSYYR